MMTMWVAPGQGASLRDLLHIVAARDERADVYVTKLAARYGWDARSNLALSISGDYEPYDATRIASVHCRAR